MSSHEPEIDIPVQEATEKVEASGRSLFEGIRRLALAGIGAVALTLDETESTVKKLVDRGEIAQKDGEKLLKELRSKVQTRRSEATDAAAQVETKLEGGIEQLMSKLNIASKNDINALSDKISQLTARIEELRKQ